MQSSNYTTIFNEILNSTAMTSNRDGSEAFDCLISIRQYARLYDLALTYLPSGCRCLDWGGGSGHFSYFLQRSGFLTHVYAFQRPALLETKINEGTVSYLQGDPKDAVNLPYESSIMDAVFSVGVLEHVTEYGGNETASLREIARILKDNGQFICYHLPNRGSWIEALARIVGRYHHVNTYTREQILTMLEPNFLVTTICRYAILPRNSVRYFPKILANNAKLAYFFDFIDDKLSKLLPWYCQNWMVIATKRSENQVTAQNRSLLT